LSPEVEGQPGQHSKNITIKENKGMKEKKKSRDEGLSSLPGKET
jgi:hypothetical protein